MGMGLRGPRHRRRDRRALSGARNGAAVPWPVALENKRSLADIANWADQIRPRRPEPAAWHYVDIPIHPPFATPTGYDASRDCPRGACIVAKIDEFAAILGVRHRSPVERLEALKYLTHLIGDIHQPLHCANNNDHGGNDIRLQFGSRETNLHRIWDTDLVALIVQDDTRSTATRLMKDITDVRLGYWREGTAVDWANESWRVAYMQIYAAWKYNRDSY